MTIWKPFFPGLNNKMPILIGLYTFAPYLRTWVGGSVMGYSRALQPVPPLSADTLTGEMVAIGMSFAAPVAKAEPNIEDTLLFASIEAMERDDLRVLAILVTWVGVHAPWVNVDRLTKIVASQPSIRVRALWAALATWQAQDRRYARMAKGYQKPQLELLATGNAFQIKRRGEDERFSGSPLRVPANVLRNRVTDVLSPEVLARQHRGYRHRVMMGPSYRADIWAALDGDPTLSAAQLARRTYGSFATAWHTRRDYGIVRSAADCAGRARSPHAGDP